MTPQEGIAVHVERWRNLRAWRRPLEEVKVTFRPRPPHQNRLGTCWTVERRITLYLDPQDDVVCSLATALHEFAHAAAPADEGHGDRWRRLYAAAVEEVTGIAVALEDGHRYREVTYTVRDALAVWWRVSGNEFAWRLLTQAQAG